jgi:hypothetical protein
MASTHLLQEIGTKAPFIRLALFVAPSLLYSHFIIALLTRKIKNISVEESGFNRSSPESFCDPAFGFVPLLSS